MIINKTSGQPALQNEVVTYKANQPLRLPIQFFADGEGGEGGKGNEGDPPPGGDGEGGEEDELSFDDLIKQNPEYKKAHNEKIEKAIKRRLKNINPDNKKPEDKKPPGDGEGGEGGDDTQSAEYKAALTRAEKLENRTKTLEIKSFAANRDGFTKDHVKLVERLSAGRLNELDLDDDGKLDEDEVAEMVDAIVDEFPTLFNAVADANQEQDKDKTNTTRKKRSPGSNQQSNDPKDNKNKGVDEMTARFERLQKKGRINTKKGE